MQQTCVETIGSFAKGFRNFVRGLEPSRSRSCDNNSNGDFYVLLREDDRLCSLDICRWGRLEEEGREALRPGNGDARLDAGKFGDRIDLSGERIGWVVDNAG